MSAITLWMVAVNRPAWPKLVALLTQRTLYPLAKPPGHQQRLSYRSLRRSGTIKPRPT